MHNPAQGLSSVKVVSAASTNATSVKAAPGKVHGWSATNVNAAVRYLKLYDKASAPTVGTDVPKLTIALQGGTTGTSNNFICDEGIAFTTGIALALTTEATDAGSTAVSASEHVINLIYS